MISAFTDNKQKVKVLLHPLFPRWSTQPFSRRKVTELPYALCSQVMDLEAFIHVRMHSPSSGLKEHKRQLATYREALFQAITDLRTFVRLHHNPATRQDLRRYIEVSGNKPGNAVREIRKKYAAAYYLQMHEDTQYHEVSALDFTPPVEAISATR